MDANNLNPWDAPTDQSSSAESEPEVEMFLYILVEGEGAVVIDGKQVMCYVLLFQMTTLHSITWRDLNQRCKRTPDHRKVRGYRKGHFLWGGVDNVR